MAGDPKLYRVVREIGQQAFEAECCKLMNLGYEPAGGVTMMQVAHPITGQVGFGFVQAMFLRPRLQISGGN